MNREQNLYLSLIIVILHVSHPEQLPYLKGKQLGCQRRPYLRVALIIFWNTGVTLNDCDTLIRCISSIRDRLLSSLRSFHKLSLHLGVGRWSEKGVVYYIKSRDVGGQKMPKNANVICASSLTLFTNCLKKIQTEDCSLTISLRRPLTARKLLGIFVEIIFHDQCDIFAVHLKETVKKLKHTQCYIIKLFTFSFNKRLRETEHKLLR